MPTSFSIFTNDLPATFDEMCDPVKFGSMNTKFELKIICAVTIAK